MKNRRSYEYIGDFNLSQPEILISDPGYEKDEWCSAVAKNCKTGKWHAFVNRNKYTHKIGGKECCDKRIAALFISHENQDAKRILSTIHLEESDDKENCMFRWRGNWRELSSNIGVDSGQAGFFAYDKYGNNDIFDQQGRCGFGDKWYSNCCDATLCDDGVGIIADCGVNASSGFGDGCYSVWQHTSNGGVDAMVLFFLADNEDVEW